MPTYNRKPFVPHAIRYFFNQDYQNKELLIVDDGTDLLVDIIPDDDQIRYIKIPRTMTLGEKRNYCVLQSRGDLIMHWDDDDWMAPNRIRYQVHELLAQNAEVCGLKEMLFCEITTQQCWLYKYPSQWPEWLAGNSLLYTRDFWKAGPFPNKQVASDTEFIYSRNLERFVVLPDYTFYVGAIHANNTSYKKHSSSLWNPVDSSVIRNLLGNDWDDFCNLNRQV